MLTAFDSDRKEERGEENQKEQARRVLPSTSFILTWVQHHKGCWDHNSTCQPTVLPSQFYRAIYTIITTRSGQGQTNLPLHPPRFGLVKITGGLIENMILRKTRALASAPGLQLGMVNLLNIYSIAQALDSVHSPSWQLRFSVRNLGVLQNEGVVRGMLKKEHQLGASCKAWIVPAIMNRKTPHKTRFEVHSKIIKGSRYNKNLQESLPRWKTNWSLALKAGGMASIMSRPMRNVCGKPWSCSIPGRVIQLPHGGGQGITFYWKDYTNSIKETLGFW